MIKEWQERLKDETLELAERLNKLHAFMATQAFYELPREEKDLLYEQSRLMNSYVQVLGKRCEIYKIRLK